MYQVAFHYLLYFKNIYNYDIQICIESYDQTKIFGKFKLLQQLIKNYRKRQTMNYVIGGRKNIS